MNKFILCLLPFLLYAEAPKLLLLETYKDQNISGWVMSEKLDGVRAYWNGKNLISRGGNVIHAPQWFIEDYPPFEVDGELWSKRGDFETIVSIVRDKVPTSQWKQIKHYIFEVPHAKGNLFERMEKARPYENNHLKIVPQYEIKDRKHLEHFLADIENKGGEGVVVRDPDAPYIARRTDKALKVKNFQDDECEVIGYSKGQGKYQGLVGAIECQMENHTTFKIGSGLSDAMRKTPPEIGSVITFKYQEFTKYGKPRFPVFLRVRNDQ